jgi:prepilin-type N-terminal cleavage/methylation domain-containing protein
LLKRDSAWPLLNGIRHSVRLSPTTSGKVRGFTLIELMVVVVIIAILAVIAVPLFGARMQGRRVLQVSGRVADLYRGARTRALARGAAITVVADLGSTPPRFQVLEAVQGTVAPTSAGGALCANLPTRGCLTNNWGDLGSGSTIGTARVVEGLGNEQIQFKTKIGSVATEKTSGTVAICFSPAGRTFVNEDGGWTPDQWATLNNVMAITVSSTNPAVTTPRNYKVLVMPNGTARLAP